MLQVLRQRLIFGRNITEQMWFANTEMNHKRLEQAAIKCLTLLNLLNMLPRKTVCTGTLKSSCLKRVGIKPETHPWRSTMLVLPLS